MKLYIKNMACESCKTVVRDELRKLHLKYTRIEFGEAEIVENITDLQKEKLNNRLKKSGLELLENKNAILIEKIKINILEFIKHPKKVKFSVYLSEKMNYDYKYLSNLFSAVQATTIEQYMIITKIEQAKELILFDDLTLTEISHRLRYTSVAHLSAQFKKVTGLTPSHYKALKKTRNLRLKS
jgi:AraC-like DNA-binding protein